MKILKILLGVLCGAIAGFTLGVLVSMAAGYWASMMNPDDPSAGSVSIIVIFFAPNGALLGALLGGITIVYRPRLFLATIVPVAVLFLLWGTLSFALQNIDRPRTFALDVEGTSGADYYGMVSIDGEVTEHEGVLPVELRFSGFQLESAFVLVNPNEEDTITVSHSVHGNDGDTGFGWGTGIYTKLRSTGYSELFGGTSSSGHQMSQEEVERLISDHVMPKSRWEW